jgi:hypothetical protein
MTNAIRVSKAKMVSESNVAIIFSEVISATILSKNDSVHTIAIICSNNNLGPFGIPGLTENTTDQFGRAHKMLSMHTTA